METENNVQKGRRTREQKEEIILQWQQSGKSRKDFCQEKGITPLPDHLRISISLMIIKLSADIHRLIISFNNLRKLSLFQKKSEIAINLLLIILSHFY